MPVRAVAVAPHVLGRWIAAAMLVSGALGPGLAITGCAHDSEEVARLRGELARAQDERDRLDHRLQALEARSAAAAAPTPPADASTTDGPATPELQVVRLSPPAQGAEGGAEGSDRGPAAEPSGPGAPARTDVRAAPEERRAYDAALALYRAKQPEKALAALAGFLVRWPDSVYADDATYWRGECYFAIRDWPHAIEHFEAVRARRSGREADALLKIGLSRLQLGDRARADEAFEELVREHPESAAARRVPRGRGER